MSERAEGFYWVRLRNSEWTVAQLEFIGQTEDERADPSAWAWYAIGVVESFCPEEFALIGQRITPPDDPAVAKNRLEQQ